jgi:hypothetical protein
LLVVGFVIALVAMQANPCRDEGAPYLASAAERGESFDLNGAVEDFFRAAGFGCGEAEIAGHYLKGLAAARDAYRYGGSAESLAPVALAIAAIDARAGGVPGIAPIARLVLRAAAAAAQTERDELALLLDQAVRLEAIQLEARQPGLPVVTAHEAAGDLWLQVHQYEDARRAYLLALDRVGMTPRVALGLARVEARRNEPANACVHYQTLLKWWGSRAGEPPEVAEARSSCAPQ